MRYDQDQVKEWLQENPGYSAEDLVKEVDKSLVAGFRAVDRAIVNYLRKVRKHFPDACYYTASGGFHLLLGDAHVGTGEPQQEMNALDGNAQIMDGDW